MKGIVFTGNRTLEVRDFEIPEPGYGEALIRIRATGICGSDLSVYRGAWFPNQIGGHEPSGEVVGLGPGVKRLKVGERVSVHHHEGCGVCPACARGETVACTQDRCVGVSVPGSFAEYMVADEKQCISLPDSVSFIDGAFMACVGGTTYAALRRAGAVAHESLAVFGLGPVGLSCVMLGKAMGLRVIGVDISPERLDLAKRCGANAAVNGAETDVPAAIHEFSKLPGVGWCVGADVIIETSGSQPAREAMLPSLCRGGRIVILGVGSDAKVINPSHVHGKAATIIGSVVFPLGWSWDLARFLAASGMSFEPAVTHRFRLEEAESVFRMADAGQGGKLIFLPHGE